MWISGSRPTARNFAAHIRLVNRGVDALGRKLPNLDYQLPGPIDGVLLEVVAEGPIPQHLEKGVVIGVQADVIQIVVFATSTDALLGVCGPSIKCRNRTGPLGDISFSFAQENWNELIHASIGEQQVGAVRHEAGAGNDRVLLGTEEVQERLADLGGRHGIRFWDFKTPRKQAAKNRDWPKNRKNPV